MSMFLVNEDRAQAYKMLLYCIPLLFPFKTLVLWWEMTDLISLIKFCVSVSFLSFHVRYSGRSRNP